MRKASLKEINGKMMLEVECEGFIIPNAFTRVSEFYWSKWGKGDELQGNVNKVLSAADLEPEDDSVLAQIWVGAKESLGIDNVVDHIGSYWGLDGMKHPFGHIFGYMPASLFRGKKEGDVISVTLPAGSNEFQKEFDVVLKMTLNQTENRYRRFGTFEQVFDQLYSSVA